MLRRGLAAQGFAVTTGRAFLVLGLAAGCVGGLAHAAPAMALQAAATSSSQAGGAKAPSAASSTAVRHKPHRAGKKSAATAQVAEPVVVIPSEPPAPNWPANDQPSPASVSWNGRSLSIAATNSSLMQTLHDVTTATGVRVEGLNALDGSALASHDQRIFGSYGPASAREVLSQILDGSGYNVIMVGDQGQGIPREVLLTVKINGIKNATPRGGQANPGQEDEVVVEDPDPAETQPENRRPFGAPGQNNAPNRSPQQMLQDLQQRQQQQQQQQQQQPPQPPQ